MKTLFKRFLMLVKALICALCTHWWRTSSRREVDKQDGKEDPSERLTSNEEKK